MAHAAFGVRVESSVSYHSCSVICNKEVLSWVLAGEDYLRLQSQCDRGVLEGGLSTKVKRQISWKITLAAAVPRKEETLARKGYGERYVARRKI